MCFSFFLLLKKGKACHSLTGYVVVVKFILFCNLETSYSMAHLIKHLKPNRVDADFSGEVVSHGRVRAQFGLIKLECGTTSIHQPAQSGWASQDTLKAWDPSITSSSQSC